MNSYRCTGKLIAISGALAPDGDARRGASLDLARFGDADAGPLVVPL